LQVGLVRKTGKTTADNDAEEAEYLEAMQAGAFANRFAYATA
jgi:hypothetical protein